MTYKKLLLALGLLVSAGSMAQAWKVDVNANENENVNMKGKALGWNTIEECEKKKDKDYPSYYCQCDMSSNVFYFGMDTVLQDTLWLEASLDDLKRGIGAYWISDVSVTMEVYVSCTSLSPALTMTIGKNRMQEMSDKEIRQKLDAAGANSAQFNGLNPMLRVYPHDGQSGRVMVFPYDFGPHSTCEDIMTCFSNMTMVSSHEKDVYMLPYSLISKNRQTAIQWQQKDNEPCTLTLTRGRCEGAEPLAKVTLTDSTKLFYPGIELMNDVLSKKDTLYLTVEHSCKVGRLRYMRTPKFVEMPADSTFCQGKTWTITYNLKDSIIKESGITGPDTCWMYKDSIGLYTYQAFVTPPDTILDTLQVRAADLPKKYKGITIEAGAYGDHEGLYKPANRCHEYHKIHVIHLVDTVQDKIDTTLCVGKSITLNGKEYKEDAEIHAEGWNPNNADEWVLTDWSIHFEPEAPIYDTIYAGQIAIDKGEVKYKLVGYYTYTKIIKALGDTIFSDAKKNNCTRYVQLTVLHRDDTIHSLVADTLKEGEEYILHDSIYTETFESSDTIRLNIDTVQITDYKIEFIPEIETGNEVRREFPTDKPRKKLIDGEMIIEIDDKRYNLLGELI